jgi:hypothetical protein
MSIVRVARRARYSTIDQRTIRDDRLSFRARGILAWLLDKPDDWTVKADVIADAGQEGRDAVRGALKELETLGYLRREKTHDAESGRWVHVSVIYERPEDADPEGGSPATGNQPAENQPAENQPAENQALEERPPTGGEKKDGEEVAPPGDAPPSEPERLASLLADLIARDGSKRPTVTAAWVQDIDRMIRIDKREPEKIERAIRWCQDDTFWYSNILSPRKLREQYDRLRKEARQKDRPRRQVADQPRSGAERTVRDAHVKDSYRAAGKTVVEA